MPEYLVFRSVVCTRVALPAHAAVELFQEPAVAASRVTIPPEAALVDWLITHREGRSLLLQELHRPPETALHSRVTAPFLFPRDKPGDIDLLVSERLHPSTTAVIEWKRVKLTPLDPQTNQVNRIDDIAQGVVQANHLLRHGFFQTYLGILIASDGAAQQHRNVFNRGMAPNTTHFGDVPTMPRLLDFPGRDDLDRRIGILFVELVQPTGQSVDNLVQINIYLHHQATPQDQRTTLTNKVVSFVQSL